MSDKVKKFMIIDGNALIHRAFHALPPMTTSSGKIVNAVYGFTTILLKALREIKPDYIAVAFDRKEPTFRHKEFKEYKAQRKKQPDELYAQIPMAQEILKSFNIPIYEAPGFEGDDIIGTVVKKNEAGNKIKGNEEVKTIIVTGDLDALQLVDDETEVYTLKKGITDTAIYNEKAVQERFEGLLPRQLIDYKALRGDPSDNIPGVKGIGEKTGMHLISTFGSLEKLYSELEKINLKSATDVEKLKKWEISERIFQLLIDKKADALISKRLVTIVTNVPFKFDFNHCKFGGYNTEKIVSFFQEYEFKSLINRLKDAGIEAENKIPTLFDYENTKTQKHENITTQLNLKSEILNLKFPHYHLIDTLEKWKEVLPQLQKQNAIAIDTETAELDAISANLVGISFTWKSGEAWYVALNALPSEKKKILEDLRPILQNEKIKKCGHNIKYDLKVLRQNGLEVNGIDFDTMIASYLLNPGSRSHGLDVVSFTEFGHTKIPTEAVIGKGKEQVSMAVVEPAKVAVYSCEDADFTWRLKEKLTKELQAQKLSSVFFDIEMPLVPVLAELELNGVKIDSKKLEKLSRECGAKIKDIEKKVYKMAGREFNVASPAQLKDVLFMDMGLSTAGIKSTKTGISTAAAELEKLRGLHPIIDLISEFRELSKLKSTYLDALPLMVHPFTGRVHTNFNQTITATGRLSSSDPNLQNIPIRTELGNKVREAFIAENGYEILSIDYSQIELRIIASLSQDEKMVASFKRGEDIHTRTAAEVEGVDIKDVTKEQRRAAKAVNFGVIYGMGSRGLMAATDLSAKEAKEFIAKYFQLHFGIKKYIDELIIAAREKGYAETFFGRRRYLPNLDSGVHILKAEAERMATNHPIQGTAADLMKLAMEKVYEKVKFDKDIKMLLQVHDELVFEVKKGIDPKKIKEIMDIMESVCKLDVPIKVEAGIGENWGNLESCNL